MRIEDKKEKLTYEAASEKLINGLHCGKICRFYSCFNPHFFQGSYSLGRGYIDNNGYWACATNANVGCPKNVVISRAKVDAYLKVEFSSLKRSKLLKYTEDLILIIKAKDE